MDAIESPALAALARLSRVNDRVQELEAILGKFIDRGGHYTGSPEWRAVIRDCTSEVPRLKGQALQESTSLKEQASQEILLVIQSSEQDWARLMSNMETYTKLAREVEAVVVSIEDDSPALKQLCPLWVALDHHLDRDTHVQARLDPWKSALESWTELQDRFGRNKTEAELVQSGLSSAQATSYRLLEDWWSGSYCDAALVQAARSYLKKQTREAQDKLLYWIDRAPHGLKGGTKTMQIAAQALIDLSLYHASCFRLFLLELHSWNWQPYLLNDTLEDLHIARVDAAYLATCQRMAFATASNFAGRQNTLTASPLSLYPEARFQENDLVNQIEDGSRPRYLWDVANKRTIEPALAGVPWPVPRNTAFDVEELPAQLVSASLGYRYIWLDLLCIPQDDARMVDRNIEVARQASVFRGATLCIAWMHDVESWKGLNASLDWMGLAFLTSVTRSPETVTALGRHTVTDKNSLDAATVRMQRDKARSAAETYSGLLLPETESKLDMPTKPVGWFSSLWTLQEAVLCPSMTLYSKDWDGLVDRSGTPIPLKSLMIFLAECFCFCCTDGPLEAMPFSDSIAYRREADLQWRFSRRDINRDTSSRLHLLPWGPTELYYFREQTGLGNTLMSASPVGVCSQANRRHSTDSRAPAIMSGLGVTKWYKTEENHGNETGSASEELILGLYPPAFVQEAALEFGPTFYEIYKPYPRFGASVWGPLRRREAQGSMLPFSDPRLTETVVLRDFALGRDGSHPEREALKIRRIAHPSVASWRINNNGSVAMSSVGILASSLGLGRFEGPTEFHVHLEDEDLKAALYSRGFGKADVKILAGAEHRVFAVSLYEDLTMHRGVVLVAAGLEPPAHGPDYLVKIGTCTSYLSQPGEPASVMPENTKVDWIVL